MYSIESVNYLSEDARATLLYALLQKLNEEATPPIIVCIGTDRVSGDCLGPIVGHLLTGRYRLPTFVYGTLNNPITAKNAETTKLFVEQMHPDRPILAVDAGIGDCGSLGELRVINDGIYPGLALKRALPKIGTHSIVGIVCEDSYLNATLLAKTKMQLVYDMAEVIAGGIADLFTIKYS